MAVIIRGLVSGDEYIYLMLLIAAINFHSGIERARFERESASLNLFLYTTR